jgi:hypothetical protein
VVTRQTCCTTRSANPERPGTLQEGEGKPVARGADSLRRRSQASPVGSTHTTSAKAQAPNPIDGDPEPGTLGLATKGDREGSNTQPKTISRYMLAENPIERPKRITHEAWVSPAVYWDFELALGSTRLSVAPLSSPLRRLSSGASPLKRSAGLRAIGRANGPRSKGRQTNCSPHPHGA